MRLLQLVADYGPGDLAYAELVGRLELLLPGVEVVPTCVPVGDTLAAGFAVARLALGDGPPDRLVVHDVAWPEPPGPGERHLFTRAHDGVTVVGSNAGWTWSFVAGAICDICELEVPAERSPHLLAKAVVRVARHHSHALCPPVPRERIRPLPEGVVVHVDGRGNLETTIAELPAPAGRRVVLSIGEISASALVHDGHPPAVRDELTVGPGSTDWPLRSGGRRRLVEVAFPGGSAAEHFDSPSTGAPIGLQPA